MSAYFSRLLTQSGLQISPAAGGAPPRAALPPGAFPPQAEAHLPTQDAHPLAALEIDQSIAALPAPDPTQADAQPRAEQALKAESAAPEKQNEAADRHFEQNTARAAPAPAPGETHGRENAAPRAAEAGPGPESAPRGWFSALQLVREWVSEQDSATGAPGAASPSHSRDIEAGNPGRRQPQAGPLTRTCPLNRAARRGGKTPPNPGWNSVSSAWQMRPRPLSRPLSRLLSSISRGRRIRLTRPSSARR